jgi:hypothetical protein
MLISPYCLECMSAKYESDQHFNKFTAPGQLRPLRERRSERPTTTFIGWADMFNIIEVATYNNPEEDALVHTHRALLKRFYDAWFDIAAERGRTKLDRLTKEYTNEKSPNYNPQLLDNLGQYTSMIRESFPQTKTVRRIGK